MESCQETWKMRNTNNEKRFGLGFPPILHRTRVGVAEIHREFSHVQHQHRRSDRQKKLFMGYGLLRVIHVGQVPHRLGDARVT